jgi:hypothetical protein
MKRCLLVSFLLSSIIFYAQVPTCSLDPAFIALNKYGIWPDSATNFVTGTVGVSYLQNITVKVPKDTNTQIGKFCFNRIVVSTPSNVTNYNLPPGLMFGSSTASLSNGTVNGATSLKFPGNANNCATIYGIPTQSGTFVLNFKVDTYATLSFGSCPNNPNVNGGTNLNTTNLTYYKIIIYPATSLNDWNLHPNLSLKASLLPNPSYGKQPVLTFHTPAEFPYQILITDLQGKNLRSQSGKSTIGINQVDLNTEKLSDGIYFVRLITNQADISLKLLLQKQ